MKGLVLSGGKGTRLRPLTFTRAKQLIPIANKPILFYVIEDLVHAGVTDIGVVISPETGAEIRQALGDGGALGAKVTYVPQAQPLGLAHAVKMARDYLGGDDFVMYLGDNMLSGGITELVEAFASGDSASTILLCPVDNPHQFGVAVLDEQGRVRRLVEKPADPPSNLALVGVYLFTPVVHKVIEALRPSWRGEYEITDAISGLLEKGCTVTTKQVSGWWKDTGQPEDLLEANRLVLSQLQERVEGQVVNSRIRGPIVLESGARVVSSTVCSPAHIAAGAVIEDAFLGPGMSVGPGARIVRSKVSHSIVMAEAEICDVPTQVDNSVIGQGVKITKDPSPGRGRLLRFVVGDSSQVRL
jgi:glucose-1-phosphate thymidylyltransferase